MPKHYKRGPGWGIKNRANIGGPLSMIGTARYSLKQGNRAEADKYIAKTGKRGSSKTPSPGYEAAEKKWAAGNEAVRDGSAWKKLKAEGKTLRQLKKPKARRTIMGTAKIRSDNEDDKKAKMGLSGGY